MMMTLSGGVTCAWPNVTAATRRAAAATTARGLRPGVAVRPSSQGPAIGPPREQHCLIRPARDIQAADKMRRGTRRPRSLPRRTADEPSRPGLLDPAFYKPPGFHIAC